MSNSMQCKSWKCERVRECFPPITYINIKYFCFWDAFSSLRCTRINGNISAYYINKFNISRCIYCWSRSFNFNSISMFFAGFPRENETNQKVNARLAPNSLDSLSEINFCSEINQITVNYLKFCSNLVSFNFPRGYMKVYNSP